MLGRLGIVLLVGCGLVAGYGSLSSKEPRRYDGYKVVVVEITNQNTARYLRNLMLSDKDVDFWSEPSRAGGSVTFMTSPGHVHHVTNGLRRNNIEYRVMLDNVQELVDKEMRHVMSKTSGEFNLQDFNTLDDIYAWMDKTAANCRNGLTCKVYSIGRSYEGRDMKVFKISKEPGDKKRCAYWLDSTIHAREWLAGATNLMIINHLATGGDANAVRLADKYDWYLMPILNVDGYSYSWTDERFWRKNRRPNPDTPGCFGTDLNRNFDMEWGMEGVSHDPCQDIYCGPSAASEPETVAVQDELLRLRHSLLATVTIHMYGRMWMFPWGTSYNHTGEVCKRAADHSDMMDVADAAANAIEATHNTRWARGTSCEVIYSTSGTSGDYMKGMADVKYPYCVEILGENFVVDKNEIRNSFEEIWNGVVAMCDRISAKHGV